MFLYFLADILRDPNLQAAFQERPEEIMREAGLSHAEQAIVREGDLKKIARLVADEIKLKGNDPFKPKQFWPKPVFHILLISPTSGERKTSVSTTVTGTYFPQDSICHLQGPDGGSTHIHGQVSDVTSGPDSSMKVMFDLSKAPTGQYDVMGKSKSQPSQASTLPNAFTVKAVSRSRRRSGVADAA